MIFSPLDYNSKGDFGKKREQSENHGGYGDCLDRNSKSAKILCYVNTGGQDNVQGKQEGICMVSRRRVCMMVQVVVV